MACKGVELAVGQIWLTRAGERVTIISNDGDCTYPWDTESGSYTDEGTTWKNRKNLEDLDKILYNPVKPISEDKYDIEEVISAGERLGFWDWAGDGPEEKTATYKSIEEEIKKKQDPEYAKYLELKAKFEKQLTKEGK